MSYILKRDQYVSKIKLIKEDSGPLGNDINWGDSLVGRLLFSIFRSVQLGVDKGKVSWYLGKLEDVLKNPIHTEAKKLDGWEDGESFIKNGAAKDTLNDTIENSPEDLEKLLEDWKEDMGEDWLKSLLEGLDPELLAIIEMMVQKTKGVSSGSNDSKIYSVMISNLTHLKAVIDNTNNVRLEGDVQKSKSLVGRYYNFQGKEGRGVCFVISQTDEGGIYAVIWKDGKWMFSPKGAFISSKNILKEIPKDKLSLSKITAFNRPTQKEINDYSKKTKRPTTPGSGEQHIDVDATTATTESMSYGMLYERVFGEKQDQAEVKGGETHLTEALNKIKKSLMVLVSQKEKGFGVDSKFIGDILSQSKTPDGKDAIKNLYKEINRFLAGDKSHELTTGSLYKESMDVIKDKNKATVVAEKIARFAKTSLQFEGHNLYGGMGEFGKELEMYNTTLNQIMGSFKSKKVSESMIFEDQTNNSKMGGWLSKFIGIKVGDETMSKIKVKGDGTVINNYFIGGTQVDMDELSKDQKGNIQSKVDEMVSDFDDKLKQHSKEYVIDAIEIVRIFNKVNRLIVRGRVPSVRSGGKITQMKANEWELISGDSEGDSPDPDSGKGPVRNRRLFQQWNDGVLVLIKKYDGILKNAKVLDKNGKPITPQYPISKFMNDALNDMKLFRAMSGRGEGGYQWQYLESHLGLTTEDLKKAGLVSGGKSDLDDSDDRRKSAYGDKGDKNTPEVVAKSTKWISENSTKFKDGCFYKVRMKPGSKLAEYSPETVYFICMKEANGKILCKMSLSDAFAKAYYHTYNPQTKDGVSKNVYKTTVSLREVNSGSKINGKCKFVVDDKESEYKFIVRSIEVLVDENENTVNRKEVIGLKVNPEYDSGINPTRDVADGSINGTISESNSFYGNKKVFKKYSEIRWGK